MPTFEKCPTEVKTRAWEILNRYDAHEQFRDTDPKIDFCFAYADVDDKGDKQGDAITIRGMRALGVAKIIALKERAMGRGDAEILLDGDWWKDASEAEKNALLDHELTHLQPKFDKRGLVMDDLGRPKLKIRLHDHEFGWFRGVAERHGLASIEQKQARTLMDDAGQYFWPELIPLLDGHQSTVTLKTGGQDVTIPLKRFENIGKALAKDIKKRVAAEKAGA